MDLVTADSQARWPASAGHCRRPNRAALEPHIVVVLVVESFAVAL